jgi:hypothetical protein
MEQENGIRKELEIVVEEVKHFGDGTRAICCSDSYSNSYSNRYTTCELPTAERQTSKFLNFFSCANVHIKPSCPKKDMKFLPTCF